MRNFLLPAVALLAILWVARPAQAQVHRCVDVNGEPVFTDQPCGAQGSAPATGDSANGVAPASLGNAAYAACSASPDVLRDRIAAAFTNKDPNLLAGLIDWQGFSRDGAIAQLRTLRDWLKQPLADIQLTGPPDPSGALPGDTDYVAPDPVGITVTTQPAGDEAPATRSFGVTRSGACWWLSF